MKIVVDEKIPWIQHPLEELADHVLALPGQKIGREDVADADILVVRTRTRCNRDLLEGSAVRLVVTATIGYDHLDTAYLESRGIEWHNCPGCNATSVAQYVHSSLLLLREERGLRLNDLVLGIVGVGHVGTAVAERTAGMGFREMLLCDPPREARGECAPENLRWTPFGELLEKSDIISFHTPLTTDGRWPTYHLLDERRLRNLPGRPVVINTSRGEVVDNAALERALAEGRVSDAIIDTWENEPDISRPLLERVYIGTPHIAGYSADGKANATRMSLEYICRFLQRPMTFDIAPPALPDDFRPSADRDALALQLYDPRRDCERLRSAPEKFEYIRGHYPLRRELLA
ncbi:MAG: 4-phosphoerythronate dehydrogenase [Bacteroidaceae bacterium]|nr:4-phosphoerythronate dehydrogenase [Bacteroidaceae bacterium]